MKKMLFVLTLVLCLPALAACHEMSSEFDEAQVYEQACRVVELCNARDYASVYAMFDQQLVGELSQEDISGQLDPMLDEFGQFEEYKTYACAGSQDKESGLNYAVISIRCAYSESKVTYTITFSPGYQLVGLYVQ